MPATPITSLGNPRIKQARALTRRKERDATGLCLAEGIFHVGEALAAADAGRATAIVRMERVRLSDVPTADAIEMTVDGSIYLGDRWEHRLSRGSLSLRAQGHEPLASKTAWCSVPREHVWIFAD